MMQSSGQVQSPGGVQELSAILQELSQPAQLQDMPRRIGLCLRALKLVDRENAQLWAALQVELGNCLAQSPLGDSADNIEQAIAHYQDVLKVRTQKDFPADWAMTQNNLGLAYNNRIRGDRAGNIEQAIAHYQDALKVRTQKDFPADWAMTQNNLAAAYNDRIRGDRADNIEQAIAHYQDALKVRTQKDFPADWAATQNNLAAAYNDRIRGDRADNIEQAISHYQDALKVYTPGEFPNYCRGTAYSLGNLCLTERRFSLAGEAYSAGMQAAGELYRSALFQSSREVELAETRDLYRRAGYALALSGQAKKSVEALERGRARGLGDSLARDRADLARIIENDPDAYRNYWQAVKDLQNLESMERKGYSSGGDASPAPRDLVIQARARMDEALGRIRLIQGYESFLKEPGWQEIAAAAVEGEPLVYLVAAQGGGAALIVYRSTNQGTAVEAVNLDGFSEGRLQEILKTWFDAYGGWQKAAENLGLNKISPDEYLLARKQWFGVIDDVTGKLWMEVIGPVFRRLLALKARAAFLIPTGLLSLLPLHAAWTDEGGRRQYLQDMIPISYIPSARALVHARLKARVADRLLAIDEPTPIKQSPLLNSHAEVTAISSLFESPQVLEHDNATWSAVLQALPSAHVAHFSCHGGAGWNDPMQGGLLMAYGEELTIKDLFELHLEGARLATLSACETGVPGTDLPDEVVSLPSAFIRVGFAGAIGSLWSVEDKSTSKLMTSFYKLWRQKDSGMAPVQALAEAQKGLRESEEYKHPFYWAAFYMTGV